MEQKFPLPPFTLDTAKEKIQAAENAWNGKNPEAIAMAYTVDSEWRNRALFINGRDEIIAFLTEKWQVELNYKLKKEYCSIRKIELLFVLNMSTKPRKETGLGLMGTKIGNSMKMG